MCKYLTTTSLQVTARNRAHTKLTVCALNVDVWVGQRSAAPRQQVAQPRTPPLQVQGTACLRCRRACPLTPTSRATTCRLLSPLAPATPFRTYRQTCTRNRCCSASWRSRRRRSTSRAVRAHIRSLASCSSGRTCTLLGSCVPWPAVEPFGTVVVLASKLRHNNVACRSRGVRAAGHGAGGVLTF